MQIYKNEFDDDEHNPNLYNDRRKKLVKKMVKDGLIPLVNKIDLPYLGTASSGGEKSGWFKTFKKKRPFWFWFTTSIVLAAIAVIFGIIGDSLYNTYELQNNHSNNTS